MTYQQYYNQYYSQTAKKNRHQEKVYYHFRKNISNCKHSNDIVRFKSASLISIGQWCDGNCDVYLNKQILTVVKKREIILEGKRNKTD